MCFVIVSHYVRYLQICCNMRLPRISTVRAPFISMEIWRAAKAIALLTTSQWTAISERSWWHRFAIQIDLKKRNGAWLFAERKLMVDWTDTRVSIP